MTESHINLADHFLIAMPNMDDPNFHQAVTYICEHNEHGALGIMVNRPTDVSLAEVLLQMDIKYSNPHVDDLPVLFGGPVHQERGFVLHRPYGRWRSSFETSSEIVVTTSRDILQAIADDQGPKDIIITLGYAGWGAGQLEEELAKNIWLSCPANPAILFETPFQQRWQKAASLMGIDIHSISGDVGHG